MDRYGADDRSSSAARSSRSLRNKASATYSSYRDDASVSSHSTSRSNSFAPIWADPIARNSGPPENFHDEDIFSYDPHSYAPAGTSTGSAHGGSTIVGTFRPSMDEMVDVNVSGHGKSFHNSSESLFRDRGDRNVRRSSVFAVGLEDIEYDAVDMSKRRCFSGLVFALIVSIVIVTTVVVVEKPSGNNPSTAALVPATAPAPAPVPNGQYVDPSVPASDCDFSGILEPDVFFQCRCHGHISIFSEGALEKYNDLKINFLAKDVLPDYHSKIDSCDPPNAALVWLATDTFPQGRETLDRYMLVLLYAAWRGYSWTHTDNWLSNQTHCDWYGIQCDSRMRTIDVLLNNNNLRGEIPSEISRLDSLLSLDVGNNQLDGRIPREIGLLASLQNLRLRGNKLSFSIPTEFGLLANLKALELDQNKLAGTIPTELMILPPLGSLDLSDNNLTGIIPSEIGNLKNCREFKIQSNTLTGRIPTEIAGMTTLTVWQSADNHCDGTIPTQLGSLDKLVTLDLSGMRLTGTMISEFGSLQALQALSLGNNDIGGSIPTEIGGMEALLYLRLHDNGLSGSIPLEISQLRELTELHLQENNLTGQVPIALAACEKLSVINLYGNKLGGQMPDEICSLRQVGLKTMISDCKETALQCQVPQCCSECAS